MSSTKRAQQVASIQFQSQQQQQKGNPGQRLSGSNLYDLSKLLPGRGIKVDPPRTEGIQLPPERAEYLLPHFFMIVVGKPGSGKTRIVKQLLTDRRMYYKAFDEVLIVSPSVSKMGVNVPKKNTALHLDFDWLWEHFARLNEAQYKKMRPYVYDETTANEQKEGQRLAQDFVKNLGISSDVIAGVPQKVFNARVAQFDANQRFFTTQVIATALGQGRLVYSAPWQKLAVGATIGGSVGGPAATRRKTKAQAKAAGAHAKAGIDSSAQPQLQFQGQIRDPDWLEKNIVRKLTPEQQAKTAGNYLLVLDDVVGEIKRNEYNPLLAQLFLNRRHLVANATVSIIVVSQKYTLIPGRVRSSASWIISFRLNPNDFEALYRDVVMLQPEQWEAMLQFVFGGSTVVSDIARDKQYNNLGIWVEYDKYFKNFTTINQISGNVDAVGAADTRAVAGDNDGGGAGADQQQQQQQQ